MAINKIFLILGGILFSTLLTASGEEVKAPVRFAMVGLVHDHAMGFFPRLAGQTDLQLVGVVETNQALIARYSRRFHLPPDIFFASLDDLFARTNPQAVATFTSTYD